MRVLVLAVFLTALVACNDSTVENNDTTDTQPEAKKDQPKKETAPGKTEEVFVTISGMG